MSLEDELREEYEKNPPPKSLYEKFLEMENARLRTQIKEVEWVGHAGSCLRCGGFKNMCVYQPHDQSCPWFTPEGEVK